MRTVVITGCSSGIGMQAALSFARAGDTVIATMRDLGKSGPLREAAAREGLTVHTESLNVTKPAHFGAFVDDTIRRHKRIDVLVNNAGVLPVGAFEDIDEKTLRDVMETNFFGPALLTRAVLPAMRRQRDGYVIMISSLSGLAAKAGDSAYSGSKFALEGLTEGLRHEVMRWNIKTALVQPAQYATEMFRTTAGGHAGSCPPDSPYRPLIASQQSELKAALPKGRDPRVLGDLLVEISRSDGTRFRWPADDVAKRVMATMFAQTDAARDRFLRDVASIDWWITGDNAPPAKDRQ